MKRIVSFLLCFAMLLTVKIGCDGVVNAASANTDLPEPYFELGISNADGVTTVKDKKGNATSVEMTSSSASTTKDPADVAYADHRPVYTTDETNGVNYLQFASEVSGSRVNGHAKVDVEFPDTRIVSGVTGTPAATDIAAGLTVEAWAKVDSITNYNNVNGFFSYGNTGIMGSTSSSSTEIQLMHRGSNFSAYSAYTMTGSTTSRTLASPSGYKDVWAHYVYTREYDATNKKFTVKLYIDGSLEGTVEEEHTTTNAYAETWKAITIGGAGSNKINNGRSLIGGIAAFNVYTSALTEEQVEAKYEASVETYYPVEEETSPDGSITIGKNQVVNGEWSLELTNNTGAQINAAAIIAHYDDANTLLAVDKHDVAIHKGETVSESYDLTYAGAASTKCFLFDALSRLHPITADKAAEAYNINPVEFSYTEAENNDITISLIGDSITVGQHSSKNYAKYLADKLNLSYSNIDNHGISGGLVTMDRPLYETDPVKGEAFVNRYDELSQDADIVFCMGGTNDYGNSKCTTPFGTTDDDENQETFCGIFRKLCLGLKERYQDSQVVILTPTRRKSGETANTSNGKCLSDYVDAEIKIAGESGIPVIDMYYADEVNFDKLGYDTYTHDNLHPNEAGHELLADYIYKQLLDMGIVERPYSEEIPQFASFYDDKDGALTLTFDDGNYDSAVYYNSVLKQNDLKGTAMVVYNNSENLAKNASGWETILADGYMDIGNHSYTHDLRYSSSSLTAEQLKTDITDAYHEIKNLFPDQNILTFATPGGANSTAATAEMKKNHYASRNASAGINSSDPTESGWFNLKAYWYTNGTGSYPEVTVEGMNAWADSAVTNKGWIIELLHGCVDSLEGSPGNSPIAKATFASHAEYLASKKDDLWVGSFNEVVAYIRERQNATAAVEHFTDECVAISLTDTLPDNKFFQPLTLWVRVPDDWTNGVKLVQGGTETTHTTVKTENGTLFVKINAVPDKGLVVLYPM